MEENKTQRIRRTRYELRTAVLKAVSELSKVKQLSLITMVDVGKQSGIRVEVLQRTYHSIEDILALYASSVDYWIANILAPRHPLDLANEEVMRKAFVSLAKNLISDRQMQSPLQRQPVEQNHSQQPYPSAARLRDTGRNWGILAVEEVLLKGFNHIIFILRNHEQEHNSAT